MSHSPCLYLLAVHHPEGCMQGSADHSQAGDGGEIELNKRRDGDSDTRQIVSDVLQGGTGCTYQRPMILASLIIFDHIIFITIISSVIMLKEQRNISSFN